MFRRNSHENATAPNNIFKVETREKYWIIPLDIHNSNHNKKSLNKIPNSTSSDINFFKIDEKDLQENFYKKRASLSSSLPCYKNCSFRPKIQKDISENTLHVDR